MSQFALGGLWDLPSKNANIRAVRQSASMLRMMLEIPASGEFSWAMQPANAWRGFDEACSLASGHGFRLVLCLGMHANGEADGGGYHQSRPPQVDPDVVASFAGAVTSAIGSRYPSLDLWIQLGNEFEFYQGPCASPGEMVGKWFPAYSAALQAVDHAIDVPALVVGGLHAKPGNQDSPSLALWLAGQQLRLRHRLVYDIHGNNETVDELQSQISGLRDTGAEVGVFEDDLRVGQKATTDWTRAAAVSEAGAICYFGFLRWLTPRWGVSRSKLDTSELGLEGPGGWNQSQFGQLRQVGRKL